MKTVCQINRCTGCRACVDVCPRSAIEVKDSKIAYNAVISEDICINCGACYRICPNNYPVVYKRPKEWYQGWANDDYIRVQGSSGGIATAIAKCFIENNGMVCSCIFKNGEFNFELVNKVEELKKFSGSKYVKSNPSGIYKVIKDELKNFNSILFIGLPCQIAGLKKYIGIELEKNLYTIDLICHGTPSPKVLEIFLEQYGKRLDEIRSIQFRKKNKYQILENNKGIDTNGITDKYMIAFFKSLINTENCYQCNYAKFERVSDITLGDSWGSSLSIKERKKGISLILCQTNKGMQLLKDSNLCLKDVDINNAIKNNRQLECSSNRPKQREKFFIEINKNKSFNKLIWKCFPKDCIKQEIKKILIKLKFFRG